MAEMIYNELEEKKKERDLQRELETGENEENEEVTHLQAEIQNKDSEIEKLKKELEDLKKESEELENGNS